MDLVGRKPRCGPAASWPTSSPRCARSTGTLADGGEDLAGLRHHLHEATDALDNATNWLLAHGLSDPNQALAGAPLPAPVRRGGGRLGDGPPGPRRQRALAAAGGDADFPSPPPRSSPPASTPRTCSRRRSGLVAPVTAGAGDLFAIEPKYL